MDCENSSNKSETRVRVSNLCLMEYACTNRKDGYFNDATIKVGDENITANRMVLSSCSPFFEKMFKSNMKESQSAVVELKEVEVKPISLLIDFIYTGIIKINNGNVLELLVAADYVQLDEVSQFCFEFIESTIDVESCCAILSVANLYEREKLRQLALNFLIANFGNVENKEANLSKSDLMSCIAKLNREEENEMRIFQFLIDWTNYDIENRKMDLNDLLQLLNFKNISSQFLEDTILNEKLVTDNFATLKFLTKIFVDMSKKNSIKATKATKIISFNNKKTMEVYNSFDDPPAIIQNYIM